MDARHDMSRRKPSISFPFLNLRCASLWPKCSAVWPSHAKIPNARAGPKAAVFTRSRDKTVRAANSCQSTGDGHRNHRCVRANTTGNMTDSNLNAAPGRYKVGSGRPPRSSIGGLPTRSYSGWVLQGSLPKLNKRPSCEQSVCCRTSQGDFLRSASQSPHRARFPRSVLRPVCEASAGRRNRCPRRGRYRGLARAGGVH